MSQTAVKTYRVLGLGTTEAKKQSWPAAIPCRRIARNGSASGGLPPGVARKHALLEKETDGRQAGGHE